MDQTHQIEGPKGGLTTSRSASRSTELTRLIPVVEEIKKRHVYELEGLEYIKCYLIVYAAIILVELHGLEKTKRSILDGARPRMTPVEFQRYKLKHKKLSGQLRQALASESRVKKSWRISCLMVELWEPKCRYLIRKRNAASAAHLRSSRIQLSSLPRMSKNAEGEFEIARDMAGKEDCAKYLVACGEKSPKDLTAEETSKKSDCSKYVLSRRMRDRWCYDESMWFDEPYRQANVWIAGIRGKEWWDQRMQIAD